MSSNLYLFFEGTKGAVGGIAAEWVQGLKISGYSFSDTPPMGDIEAADEGRLAVRCLLYARNYFRIYVADMAVQFAREVPLPSDLALGEQEFQAAILAIPDIRLRRWISTDEDWDDDDKEVVQVLGEGKNQETLKAYQTVSSES